MVVGFQGWRDWDTQRFCDIILMGGDWPQTWSARKIPPSFPGDALFARSLPRGPARPAEVAHGSELAGSVGS